ncbi:hypothetical protein BJ741DRAFT_588010 [Chytriomyces cf. hyalinus JEL632]|nr:hypothetical protein BJ741DRAFT_588010 [Chytriomyces cf. hyalinus JEL632]
MRVLDRILGQNDGVLGHKKGNCNERIPSPSCMTMPLHMLCRQGNRNDSKKNHEIDAVQRRKQVTCHFQTIDFCRSGFVLISIICSGFNIIHQMVSLKKQFNAEFSTVASPLPKSLQAVKGNSFSFLFVFDTKPGEDLGEMSSRHFGESDWNVLPFSSLRDIQRIDIGHQHNHMIDYGQLCCVRILEHWVQVERNHFCHTGLGRQSPSIRGVVRLVMSISSSKKMNLIAKRLGDQRNSREILRSGMGDHSLNELRNAAQEEQSGRHGTSEDML